MQSYNIFKERDRLYKIYKSMPESTDKEEAWLKYISVYRRIGEAISFSDSITNDGIIID